MKTSGGIESSHAKCLDDTQHILHAKWQFVYCPRKIKEQVPKMFNDTYFLIFPSLDFLRCWYVHL